jgi:hypothetical protein
MSLPGLVVPVNPWTGQAMRPVVIERMTRLKEAQKAFRLALHELDGTTEGSMPGNRSMAVAFTKLDEATMWAGNAILGE